MIEDDYIDTLEGDDTFKPKENENDRTFNPGMIKNSELSVSNRSSGLRSMNLFGRFRKGTYTNSDSSKISRVDVSMTGTSDFTGQFEVSKDLN